MSTDVERPRIASRFTWKSVDRELTRALLEAAYRANGDTRALEALDRKADGELASQAERSLGSPPAMRHLDTLVGALRDLWLPTLSEDELAELVNLIQHDLTGPARNEQPRSSRAKIEFIRARRRTHNFKLVLRKRFVALHRERVLARTAGTTVPADAAPRILRGMGRGSDVRQPYPHQLEAWAALDRMVVATDRAHRGGLLELPTGAGKTYTIVHWLLQRMAKDPRLKVLWIADRQELVEQAAQTFVKVADAQPVTFERMLRRIYDGASPVTTIADEDLDIAVATRQSLRGSSFSEGAKKRISAFLSDRSPVVVVDEAHHAIAPTYEDLLDFLQEHSDPLVIGLTATPWPGAAGATKRLRARFPQTVAKADVGELIRSGILAKPVHHSIDTGERVELSEDDRELIARADLPPRVLRRFDSERRNGLIVETWWERRSEWGKTLVFAVDIDHAERLYTRFDEHGADTKVLHSRSAESRSAVLDWFRRSTGPRVLVSVGMLTEGVDLPSARTAVLARPTTSRILLRQMIGRVLRGPLAAGDAIAHIVDVRDQWNDDVDVLRPIEIPTGGEVEHGQPGLGEDRHRLPPVLDELTGDPVPEDVLSRALRAYGERVRGRADVRSTALVGFYRLDDLSPPVFDHTEEAYRELIEAELRGDALTPRRLVEFFDDLPVPRPLDTDAAAVVEFVRSRAAEPPFQPLRVVLDPLAVARELWNLALPPAEQMPWLRQQFESGLARSAYRSLQAFHQAVQREMFDLARSDDRSGLDAENPRKGGLRSSASARLQPSPERDLPELLRRVKARGRALLADDDPHYVDLLATPIDAAWTRKPITWAFAYWAPRRAGRRRGEPRILVSLNLSAPQIADEVLEYLLWHEVGHHLLPGQGHDAEFRRLEARWPGSEKHDHFLDSLGERYDLKKCRSSTREPG